MRCDMFAMWPETSMPTLVTWESTCTLGVVLWSSFPSCNSHLNPNLYFPSATAQLDPWRVPVHTLHLFAQQASKEDMPLACCKKLLKYTIE
jgi:hypothetical protein